MRTVTDKARESDEELMARFQAGESAAMEALFARYQKPLFNFFYRMVSRRETAEDLVQETFVKLCRFGSSFRGSDAKFSTWLYSVAGNQCRDYLRHSARRPETLLDTLEESQPEGQVEAGGAAQESSVEEHILRMETREILRTAIESLPDKEYRAIMLREYQGLDYQEIANVLGCPLGSVKVLIFRARQRLRDRLRDLQPEQ